MVEQDDDLVYSVPCVIEHFQRIVIRCLGQVYSRILRCQVFMIKLQVDVYVGVDLVVELKFYILVPCFSFNIGLWNELPGNEDFGVVHHVLFALFILAETFHVYDTIEKA